MDTKDNQTDVQIDVQNFNGFTDPFQVKTFPTTDHKPAAAAADAFQTDCFSISKPTDDKTAVSNLTPIEVAARKPVPTERNSIDGKSLMKTTKSIDESINDASYLSAKEQTTTELQQSFFSAREPTSDLQAINLSNFDDHKSDLEQTMRIAQSDDRPNQDSTTVGFDETDPFNSNVEIDPFNSNIQFDSLSKDDPFNKEDFFGSNECSSFSLNKSKSSLIESASSQVRSDQDNESNDRSLTCGLTERTAKTADDVPFVEPELEVRFETLPGNITYLDPNDQFVSIDAYDKQSLDEQCMFARKSNQLENIPEIDQESSDCEISEYEIVSNEQVESSANEQVESSENEQVKLDGNEHVESSGNEQIESVANESDDKNEIKEDKVTDQSSQNDEETVDKITKWKIENDEQIRLKDELELKSKDALKEQAKKELDDWYSAYGYNLKLKKANNR